MKKILIILALLIALPAGAATYTIQSGDTLSGIANRVNSTVSQLLSLNPQIQNPDLIYEGDDIEVPEEINAADLFIRPLFGGSAGVPITDYETTLTTPLTSSATTINVASVDTTDGFTLTTADISPAVYLVIDPDSSTKKEIVKCTAISGTSFTGCTRGLKFVGEETEVAANKKAHSAGAAVVLSDVHLLFVSLNAEQTWTRVQEFDVYPVASSTIGDATTTYQFLTLGQANSIANQGAATSTETVSGISQLATQIEHASSTDGGVNDPLVLQAKYATSTPNPTEFDSGLFIVVSENDGYISQNWLDLSESFIFTGNNTSTGQFEFDGTVQFDGNATSTASFDVSELCFDGTDCVTNQFTSNYYASSTQPNWTATQLYPAHTVTIPALGVNDAVKIDWFMKCDCTNSGTDGLPALRLDSSTTTQSLGDPGTGTIIYHLETFLVNQGATDRNFVDAEHWTGPDSSGTAASASSTRQFLNIDTSDGIIIDGVQPNSGGWGNDTIEQSTFIVKIIRNYLTD